jgi:glycogen debranching enzyme
MSIDTCSCAGGPTGASMADRVSPDESAHAGERRGLLPRYTLKDGDTFLLADALGDVQAGDDGLFASDTRILSRFEMQIAGKRPSLLGAAIAQDNTLFTAHLTNQLLPALGELAIPKGVIHIERARFLCDGRINERLRFTNYSGQHAMLPVTFNFSADFVDVFEVQGRQRAQRGTLREPEVGPDFVRLAYMGLDRRLRTTEIHFSETPASIDCNEASFSLDIPREAVVELYVEVGPASDAKPSQRRFADGQRNLTRSMGRRIRQGASIASSGRLFNEWLHQARADLALLTTTLPTGPYPYAGIPWFATQFGRDAIITSLQTLWINPDLAAGVLRFLALTQAHEESAFRDAEPGKILHEMRRGEMAVLHEVPFRQYYGGVDTTPLFVVLAGAYEERTADSSLIDEIWDNLVAAISWIEQRLERSASGFLDYARAADSGLVNQGWKDSQDSIFHADGRLPSGPIAVVEVQAYACAALRAIARLADERGLHERAAGWRARAERLAAEIERCFWIPDLDFYAIAMDGDKHPCRVRASNAGHLLFFGLPSAQRAAQVSKQLLSVQFCTGWGIRTLAEGEARFNPMSYHNGSVWPHDAALCIAGIARYFGPGRIIPLLNDVFEAANHFSMRLPELYCGFARTPGQGPTPYPVACQPQAWASGALFMLLQAALGLRIDCRNKQVHLARSALPIGIESLTISDLRLGDERIELRFRRVGSRIVPLPTAPAGSTIQVLASA